MKVVVAVKRVIDYNVKERPKADGSGVLYFLVERTALVKTAVSTGGQTDSDARPE